MMNQLIQAAATQPEAIFDPVALNARLMSLREEYERTKLFQAPPGASEPEVAILRENHAKRVASMIEEQIDIIARLRRTASGPAKAGGKRAKNAPPDLSNLLED